MQIIIDVEAHTAALKVQCCCKLAGVGVASDSPENDELVGCIPQVSVGVWMLFNSLVGWRINE